MGSKRIIKNVAVLGSGLLGSCIACQFANAGLQVLLLHNAANGADAKSRNKAVNDTLASVLKTKPSPVYSASFISRITTGNFEDDLPKIAACDWIVEAIEDDNDGKRKLLSQIDRFRKPGTLVTATSSDRSATTALSEDFRKHFCEIHFSGTPRYAESLAITPLEETLPEVVDFFMLYGEKYLGKTTTIVNDSPKKQQAACATEECIFLEDIRGAHTIWKNDATTITDLGDGIINLEFRTEKNIINSDVLQGINQAITLAEDCYKGLVIANEGENFSSGGDLGAIYNLAAKQRFDELDILIKTFQHTMMRIRYSGIPVVAAPHRLASGAGCGLCLHADKVVAHAELYTGMDEFNAGLIPYSAGTKEFILRLSDELHQGDVEVNSFRRRFLSIAQAKVSTSAYEAIELGYLEKGRDVVVMSRKRLLAEAKKHCLLLADAGYVQAPPRNNIRVLGKQILGAGYAGANSMYAGNYISEYDMKISQKLAFVMTGGDLSQPALVSDDYLLQLEREIFLSLCAETKTLERMQSILACDKILHN